MQTTVSAIGLNHGDTKASALDQLAILLPIVEITGGPEHYGQLPVVATRSFRVAADRLARILFRTQQRHAVVTGRRGVGKTALGQYLAQQAGNGRLRSLAGARFVWIDCANVGPEDSRACLESIFGAVNEELSQAVAAEMDGGEPSASDGSACSVWRNADVHSERLLPTNGRRGRHIETLRLVLCLDNMAALLKRPHGGSNKPLLRALMARTGLRVIGVMSDWEYTDLIGGDAAMLDCFARVELEEPDEAAALAIVRTRAEQLGDEFDCQIDAHVVERAVALTSTFVLNEHHPAKAVRILRQVCEDAEFRPMTGNVPTADGEPLENDEQADQWGNGKPGTRVSHGAASSDSAFEGTMSFQVTVPDVVRTVAEKTGLPIETIVGEESAADFEAALTDAVVGQENVVREVAAALRLVKAGLSEPGKPATVLLFAGMTGVGKTELAKRIAELYSTSRRLQVYAMGNYTEPHSVSGIIGVPPGYVGHEEGGRLINELNADPYSVFLLDEAEKCHPNLWKPFLNLFDEGWIADQRGVKAHADRAIFILTTNAGDKNLAQMARSGKPPEEIARRVKQILSKVRLERSSQPVFPPQFLSRIQRILVFNPLDEDAMIGIAERVCRRMQQSWLTKREKQLAIADEVIAAIGKYAHAVNEQAHGDEGGRLVQKLVSDIIEGTLQQAALADPAEYRATKRIDILLKFPPAQQDQRSDGQTPAKREESTAAPEVKIHFGCKGNTSTEQLDQRDH